MRKREESTVAEPTGTQTPAVGADEQTDEEAVSEYTT
jgi:hypothetical protein